MYNRLFFIFSFVFIAFAVYHLIGVFYVINDSPAWRHGIFFALSIFGIYGILKRPKYFVFLFGILLLQQLYSHGGDLIHIWQTEHKVDWISLFVLLFLPTVFVFLILDRVKKN